MNGACLADFMEYAGQYRKYIYGGYDGCNCANCKILRNQSQPLTGRQANDIVNNNWYYDKNNN